PSKTLAKALALQVGQVQTRFDENRRALHPVRSQGGQTAYPHQEVTGLIARTREDLDQAMTRVRESGLEPLRAWSAEELLRVKDAAPQEGMITAEQANRLLDQVGEVVGRILFLAAHDDLEVTLWVGSTPAPHATFSFWPQGKI